MHILKVSHERCAQLHAFPDRYAWVGCLHLASRLYGFIHSCMVVVVVVIVRSLSQTVRLCIVVVITIVM